MDAYQTATGADRHRPGRTRDRPRTPHLRDVLRSVQPTRQHLRPGPRGARRHRTRLLRSRAPGGTAPARPQGTGPGDLHGTWLLAGDDAAGRRADPVAGRIEPVP